MNDYWQGNVGFRDADGGKLMQTLQARHVILSSVVAVTAVATPLPAVPLTLRRSMLIYNQGTVVIYIGGIGVTVANGLPLIPKASLRVDIADDVIIYAIIPVGENEVRVLEGA